MIIIDTTPPQTDLSYYPDLFSPDGNYIDDDCFIEIDQIERNGIQTWTLEIKDEQGQLFRTYNGTDRPPLEVMWDGYNNSYSRCAESFENYYVTLTSVDVAGNVEETDPLHIEIGPVLVQIPGGFRIRISNVEFAVNRAEIRPSFQRMLDIVADILARKDAYYIRIEGHCDWTGPARRNYELSNQRAQSVVNYLVNQGINSERFTSLGYSFYRPIETNTTAAGRQRNRRVDFILTYEPLTDDDLTADYNPSQQIISEMRDRGLWNPQTENPWNLHPRVLLQDQLSRSN